MYLFDGRDTRLESEIVQQAINIVQRPKHRDYSSIRAHMRRARIAVAVRNGVDSLEELVQL